MRSVHVDEEEVVYRAMQAFMRRFPGADFPGNSSALDDRDIVVLRNCNGVLARYRYDRESDKLFYLK